MTPENKVKAWLVKEIKLKYPTAWVYKPPGGAYGKKGVPDIVMCISGLFVAIEVKASDKSELTAMQIHQLTLINDAKGIGASMKGKDRNKLERLFKVIDHRMRTSQFS